MAESSWTHVTRGRGRERGRGRGRGRLPFSQTRTYSQEASSSNSPVIQLGKKTLINAKITQESSSGTSIHLNDIPEGHPLYEQMKAYLASQQQTDSFASVTKERDDVLRPYERVPKKEMIFILENSEIL